jgi:hypothetical protein
MRVSTPRRPFAFAALASLLSLSLSCGGDSGDPSPTPTEVLVTPGADTLLSVGETQAFVAVVLDANGDPIDDAEIVWSSSVPGVVSVDPVSGMATAVTNGSALVRATSGALEGTAPVTVAQVPATVTVSPSTGNFTFAGDTLTFTATVLDAGGAPVAPVQKVWTINDNTVAVIDSNGHARAKAAGLAMVTVVAIGPGGAKAGYAAVQSTQPVASLHIRSQPTNVVAGEALDPAVQVEVRDSGGAVIAGYAGPITIGIDSGPASPVLRGTRTVNAINGVASYSGLTLERAGTHRLSATAASATPVTSAPFTVSPAASHRIEITLDHDEEFGAIVAGGGLYLQGALLDRFGNLTHDSLTPLAIELIAGPAGAELIGDPAAAPLSPDERYFPGATIHRAGEGYRVRIIGDGILPDTSGSFPVEAAAPYRVVVLNDPEISAGFYGWGVDSLQIDIRDEFDNPTDIFPGVVSISTFGWAYAAPPGREPSITPPGMFVVMEGVAPYYLPPFGITRPGATGIIIGVDDLVPDTLAVEPRHILAPLKLAAGGNTTCVGEQPFLLCVGANDSAMMGVASAALASDSVLIGPDIPIGGQVEFAVGGRHVCRVTVFGVYVVSCRGSNDEGQLGVAGPSDSTFQAVPGVSGVWRLTAGGAHTCALVADSTAVCWGANDHGQLGRGTTTPFETGPAAVGGGHKWQAISAGDRHTCGVTAAGAALCWGANGSGQLGDSTQTDRPDPTPLYGAGTWRAMAAGGQFSCGERHNGFVFRVVCWGDNSLGQVGVAGGGLRLMYTLPNFTPANQPQELVAGGAHACVRIEGIVRCWGDNGSGQVGTGSVGGVVDAPTVVALPYGGAWGTGLTAGWAHTCASQGLVTGLEAFTANKVWCWGANDRGQLGDGTTVDRGSPAEMIR